MEAHLVGRGLWTPGFADLFAWLEGDEDAGVQVPPCDFIGSRLLRATSTLTRELCEVAWQASQEAGLDPSATPTVFGSMHGEIRTAVDQMDMLHEGDGIISPARFKNSVHNTAAGIYSIATRNRAYTTAIAAGPATLAMCLLEAMALLHTDEDAVVVTVGEERLPPFLERYGGFAPLGVAFALVREAEPGASLARLASLRRDPDVTAAEPPERFRGNPCAPGLALLERHARGEYGTVPLEPSGGEGWCVDVLAP